MLSLYRRALEALDADLEARLQAAVRRHYHTGSAAAAVDDVYVGMMDRVRSALPEEVERQRGELIERAEGLIDAMLGAQILDAVQRHYPVWGWRKAEMVVDDLHDERRRQQGQELPRWITGTRDTWETFIHANFSLEQCVRRLAVAAAPFVAAWWRASLGSFNWSLPNMSYNRAERRGAYLYEVFRNPVPRVIVPQQGLHQVVSPRLYGAPWGEVFCPGGLGSIMGWLTESEQSFMFATVYMMFGTGHTPAHDASNGLPQHYEAWLIAPQGTQLPDQDERYERGERMLLTLTELVQRRVRGELDTDSEAVMGVHWSRSYVTMLTLRSRRGERLAAPSQP